MLPSLSTKHSHVPADGCDDGHDDDSHDASNRDAADPTEHVDIPHLHTHGTNEFEYSDGENSECKQQASRARKPFGEPEQTPSPLNRALVKKNVVFAPIAS